MAFLAWLNEHLTGSRTRPDDTTMRTADELLETKRTLIRFTNDLNAGRIDTNDTVVHIRRNVLERSILGNREDPGNQ